MASDQTIHIILPCHHQRKYRRAQHPRLPGKLIIRQQLYQHYRTIIQLLIDNLLDIPDILRMVAFADIRDQLLARDEIRGFVLFAFVDETYQDFDGADAAGNMHDFVDFEVEGF
jgi:hypothetical protein